MTRAETSTTPPSGDKPPIEIRPSALSRHQLTRVTATTWAKPETTLALPGVDVAHEIDLINQGFGEKVGDSRYRLNGRVYVVKANGAAYPESGDDVVHVDRPTFLALRLLVQHGGQTEAFDRNTEQNPTYTEVVIRKALRLFELRKGE